MIKVEQEEYVKLSETKKMQGETPQSMAKMQI